MMLRRVVSAVISLLAAACAPEPTTPATTDLSGKWAANAHLYTLADIRLNMVQEARGIVSGGWTAKVDGGGGGCKPLVPCDAFGNLIGRNTIAKVEIELLGAGKFEGALVEPGRLRGVLIVEASFDTITFVRAAQ